MFMGCCEKGDLNTVYAFSNYSDVVDELGQGPLAEDLCYALAVGGGPVYATRLDAVADGAAGAVTKTYTTPTEGTGTLTVDGASKPLDAYDARLFVVKAGRLGDAEFLYTLDNGYTMSQQLVIPSGGSYTIPSTGVTLTFANGAGVDETFNVGDVFSFTCTAPTYGATELADGVDALMAVNLSLASLVLSGAHADAATSATLAAAVGLHAESLFAQMRYVRTIIDAGAGTPAAAITGYASMQSARVCVAYGDCNVVSVKPIPGWSTPRRPISQVVAGRCASILISTDPARNASGALPGVVAISHDEFRKELLDQKGFTTLRTWQGERGFYITNARLMCAPGSDYQYWQYGRVMDTACDTVARAQFPLVSSAVKLNSDGTVAASSADKWEKQVGAQLRVNLLDPDNAEGFSGHVTDLSYKVDTTNNVQQSGVVKTRVAVQPLGYAKQIETELGFAAGVGG